MIYTVTFNPAIDYVMFLDGIKTGCVNRSSSENIFFGRFGSAGNFGGLSALSKIVLSFDMLIGRLEIYPLIMLFAVRKR